MSNKKLTIKRLGIFLGISFVPFCIIIPVMWACFGEPIYTSTDPGVMTAVYALGVSGMMIPSAANLITRLVTKEGFGNSYLGANLKGRTGWWIASAAVKLVENAVIMVLMWALFLGGMSFSDTFVSPGMPVWGLFLLQLAGSLILFFPAFGEEWGWRGYMMPKLMEIMPKPAAIITGGIIWGLWHAPLTVAGHNFGTDYPGYPFVGIGLMCLMCVAMNAFLTLLTEKTKSIYPAAFCHSVNNNLSTGVLASIFCTETAAAKIAGLPPVTSFLPYLAIMAVTAAVSMILLLKKPKNAETE